MSHKRTAISLPVTRQLLHDAGFRCANPTCRTIITLEIHHIDRVSDGGSNSPDNLLVLCPNCHTLHHNGAIPTESLKTWKLLLLSLNEGFDRASIDVLLAMPEINQLSVSGDGFIHIAGLVTGGYLRIAVHSTGNGSASGIGSFCLYLTDKGRNFIEAWKRGDQRTAIEG